jgi:hypothetical protein
VTLSGDPLNLLLPGLLTVLLYAFALFVVVASRRPMRRTHPPAPHARRTEPPRQVFPVLPPPKAPPPRLRVIEGGAARREPTRSVHGR